MSLRLQIVSVALLTAGLLVSAVGVVYTKHKSRTLFVELQRLQSENDAMSVEWGRLLLEDSTWATANRVETMARNKLGMVIPGAKDIFVVQP